MVCFGEKFPITKIAGAGESPLFPVPLLFPAKVLAKSNTDSEEQLILGPILSLGKGSVLTPFTHIGNRLTALES